MLESILNTGRKVIPRSIFEFFQPAYHWLLSMLAPLIYGNPSKDLIVIGVTGTKGKSTTCYLLARILEDSLSFDSAQNKLSPSSVAGRQGDKNKVGMTSGIIFKIAEKEWLNDKKMTMLGRFAQQRLLRDMVKAGCKYAIIETTSEGIKLYRHLGINYDVVVFTNLYPEHIDSHGTFDNYKAAKGKLFEHLSQKPRKEIFNKKISIINLDDKYADYFLKFGADEKYGFEAQKHKNTKTQKQSVNHVLTAADIEITSSGSRFQILNSKFLTHLLGEMNVYNCLAAITVAQAVGVSLPKIQQTLEKIKSIPGRLEFIDSTPVKSDEMSDHEAQQDFDIIVDYAHDPESLRQLFSIIYNLGVIKKESKIIHVFGATGGGRDKKKRPIMGQISDENSDVIILTNDDPYGDDPEELMLDIAEGVKDKDKVIKILDRRQAIRKALSLAESDGLVMITGKGSEQAIVLADGHHPWDDRTVVREELSSHLH